MTRDCDDMFFVFVQAKVHIKAVSELTVDYYWGEDRWTSVIICECNAMTCSGGVGTKRSNSCTVPVIA